MEQVELFSELDLTIATAQFRCQIWKGQSDGRLFLAAPFRQATLWLRPWTLKKKGVQKGWAVEEQVLLVGPRHRNLLVGYGELRLPQWWYLQRL